MYRLMCSVILFVILIALLAGPAPLVQAQEPTCPGLVSEALLVVDEVCNSASSNQACYGHARLDAVPQPHVQSLAFNEAGDLADVVDLQSLRLSPMNLDTGWWGVGLIRVRTYVPNANARQNASILLFGDVAVKNAVQAPTASAEVMVHTVGGASARVRTAPYDGLVIAALSDGDTVTATGRTEDGLWVRINLPDTERPGWIYVGLLAQPDATDDLPVAAAASAQYGSMQAFTFTSGRNDSACAEAPNSGMIIQTVEGEAKVTFLINEVNVDLGSTAFIQATPDHNMAIYLIEGSSQVTAANVSYSMVAGTVITLPTNDTGIVSGPPGLPAAYSLADLVGLPVAHLDRPVTIAPPLDEISLAQLNRRNLGEDDEDPLEEPIGDGIFGGVGGPADTGGPDPKITICHNGKVTITISPDAWPAHEAHGDTQGPCPQE